MLIPQFLQRRQSQLPLIVPLLLLVEVLALKTWDTMGAAAHLSWRKAELARSLDHLGLPGLSSVHTGASGVLGEQATRHLLWTLKNETLQQSGWPDTPTKLPVSWAVSS